LGVQKRKEAFSDSVPQKSGIIIGRIRSVGYAPFFQIPEHVGTAQGKEGPQNTGPPPRSRDPVPGHNRKPFGAGTPEETHTHRFEQVLPGVSSQNPEGAGTAGFPVPGGMAEKPRRPFDTKAIALCRSAHPARSQMYDTARHGEDPAEGRYGIGVSPAFPGGTYPMFYVKTMENKTQMRSENGQGGKHSGRIGPPGNGGEKNRTGRPASQPLLHRRFKGVHAGSKQIARQVYQAWG
jgi:hypothetical protein